jgi:hypothetical protein
MANHMAFYRHIFVLALCSGCSPQAQEAVSDNQAQAQATVLKWSREEDQSWTSAIYYRQDGYHAAKVARCWPHDNMADCLYIVNPSPSQYEAARYVEGALPTRWPDFENGYSCRYSTSDFKTRHEYVKLFGKVLIRSSSISKNRHYWPQSLVEKFKRENNIGGGFFLNCPALADFFEGSNLSAFTSAFFNYKHIMPLESKRVTEDK